MVQLRQMALRDLTVPDREDLYLRELEVAAHSPGYMGPTRCLGNETVRSRIITSLLFKLDERTTALLTSSLPACTFSISVALAVDEAKFPRVTEDTSDASTIEGGGSVASLLITSGKESASGDGEGCAGDARSNGREIPR